MTNTATANTSALLPLQVQEANYKTTGVIYLTAGSGDQQHEIAAIACLDPVEAKAIAERICMAVNRHDELVAMLRKFERGISSREMPLRAEARAILADIERPR